MMQVINAQNILIMKLLQKQNALYHQLNQKFVSSESGSRSTNKQNPSNKASAGSQDLNNL